MNQDIKTCIDLIEETGATIGQNGRVTYLGEQIGWIGKHDSAEWLAMLNLAAVVTLNLHKEGTVGLLESVYVKTPGGEAIASKRCKSHAAQVAYLQRQFKRYV